MRKDYLDSAANHHVKSFVLPFFEYEMARTRFLETMEWMLKYNRDITLVDLDLDLNEATMEEVEKKCK